MACAIDGFFRRRHFSAFGGDNVPTFLIRQAGDPRFQSFWLSPHTGKLARSVSFRGIRVHVVGASGVSDGAYREWVCVFKDTGLIHELVDTVYLR